MAAKSRYKNRRVSAVSYLLGMASPLMGAKANLRSVAARVSNLSGSQPAGPARGRLLRKLLFIRQFAGGALHRDRGQNHTPLPARLSTTPFAVLILATPGNYTQPDWVTAKARRLGMDTSIFAFDLPAWLSWSSDVLYLATFGLALIVILLISCLVEIGRAHV